jgi:hypothetical protein
MNTTCASNSVSLQSNIYGLFTVLHLEIVCSITSRDCAVCFRLLMPEVGCYLWNLTPPLTAFYPLLSCHSYYQLVTFSPQMSWRLRVWWGKVCWKELEAESMVGQGMLERAGG